MDCLRLEWSSEIADSIISFVDCLNDYKTTSKPKPPREVVPESSCSIAVNVALSHINLFLIINEQMCLMTRIDAVTLEKTDAKSSAIVSGLKMVEMVPYQGEKSFTKLFRAMS